MASAYSVRVQRFAAQVFGAGFILYCISTYLCIKGAVASFIGLGQLPCEPFVPCVPVFCCVSTAAVILLLKYGALPCGPMERYYREMGLTAAQYQIYVSVRTAATALRIAAAGLRHAIDAAALYSPIPSALPSMAPPQTWPEERGGLVGEKLRAPEREMRAGGAGGAG